MNTPKIRQVKINKDLLSYRTAIKGNWVFKASVYKDQQVLLIGYNDFSGEFFTRRFDDYEAVVMFLSYIAARDSGLSKNDFPES